MTDKLNEKLSGHQSELSYAGPGRSKKDLQRAYHKAHRAGASAEIESQLASVDVELPDRSIGDIVPISKEEWESYSGIPTDPKSSVPSEKEAYLFDLAYDVADGRVDMHEDDIIDLDAHVLDQFGWSFSYSVSGHGADISAQNSRDEYYDEPQWDEADQDWANQQDIDKYGDPEDDNKGDTLSEARWAKLAGITIKESLNERAGGGENFDSHGFPPLSHPLISQYADGMRGPIVSDKKVGDAWGDPWFKEYVSYTYSARPNNIQAKQSITLYRLINGKYFARIYGSYNNRVSHKNPGEFDDPIDAIQAALDSSVGGYPPPAKNLIKKVGEKIGGDPTGGAWYD